uniref:Uncharacterized protein n=1 Tax=Heterorhabditis bacteriophora TaxID=37862 RepID=A0A1I7WX73_HETBA
MDYGIVAILLNDLRLVSELQSIEKSKVSLYEFILMYFQIIKWSLLNFNVKFKLFKFLLISAVLWNLVLLNKFKISFIIELVSNRKNIFTYMMKIAVRTVILIIHWPIEQISLVSGKIKKYTSHSTKELLYVLCLYKYILSENKTKPLLTTNLRHRHEGKLWHALWNIFIFSKNTSIVSFFLLFLLWNGLHGSNGLQLDRLISYLTYYLTHNIELNNFSFKCTLIISLLKMLFF